MERRTITNIHELRLERDFLKKEVQLKFMEISNEWTLIKSSLQQILFVGAAQKVFGIFKKKE
jgi:hypothetical protein